MKDGNASLFNKDWYFHFGDLKNAPDEKLRGSAWERVDLPHDRVISRPFERGKEEGYTSQNMQGFFAWQGICWYRKEFTLPCLDGKEVYIYFGGAYRNSTVFVNGHNAGGRAFGYSSFELDISGFVKEGKNLVAVRLNNGNEKPLSKHTAQTDRWYSGSGLYRNVYLKIVPVTHIKTWGVHVLSKLKGSSCAGSAACVSSAEVTVKTTIADQSRAGRGKLKIRLEDKRGKTACECSAPFKLDGKTEIIISKKMQIEKPLLWSAETPNLYNAVVQLEIEDKTGKNDSSPVEIRFGIRNIDIVNHKGMIVNNKAVKLKGVCLHHDAGITGSAYYDAVWRRRLLTLKSLGCNAIRTSHNPPAEEFLDLCDELGFYVLDECFDKWKSGCYAEIFETDARRDLTDMILRDRNHPSVFMWSIGNEVENQGTSGMISLQKKLTDIARSIDTRPVTCALSPHANPRSLVVAPVSELVKLTKKLAKDVDVLGLNYHEPLYQHYTEKIDRPILGTECYGYYSSVDTNFEDVCDKNPWSFVLESGNVIGQFIWAGIDYLGECSWPAKGWTGSILDICGFMKPNAYFRKSIWSDEKMIYLAFYDQNVKPNYARGRWSFPSMTSHLNHEHFIRRTVTAAIFTNCDEAELWINGKKLGRRNRSDFKNGIIEWTFEYQQGEIEVKGFNKGKAGVGDKASGEICSYRLKTAGQPKKICLLPDRTILSPGDIAHIEVNITDKDGILCPNEDVLVEFAIKENARKKQVSQLKQASRILGACSPDLNQSLGFTLPKTVTSGGRALVMIKAGDTEGDIELSAYCEKLKKSSIRFMTK